MSNHRRPARLKGHIHTLTFRGQPANLKEYLWKDFDANHAEPSCKIKMEDKSVIAFSRWSSPKRTRTYPFSRVYDTYSHNGKIITVIPVVKDEGRGERRNDTNLDRINFITLSWMNLMNVYVILAWYEKAERVTDFKITNQHLANDYIRNQISEIVQYKLDAHHWNREHFANDFIPVYRKAIESYQRIAREQNVAMHDYISHERFIDSVKSEVSPDLLDLQKYKDLTLRRSKMSASSEVVTLHRLEYLQTGSVKGLLEIQNNLGGIYYLTVDEVLFMQDGSVTLQESKNASNTILPSKDDIKDGLFKLLLFSSISELSAEQQTIPFQVCLRLTGRLAGSLHLPCSAEDLMSFLNLQNTISYAARQTFAWLNEEARALGIQVLLEGPRGSS